MRSIEELLKLLGTSKVSEVQIEQDRGGGVGANFAAVQANYDRRRANPWVARHGKVSHDRRPRLPRNLVLRAKTG